MTEYSFEQEWFSGPAMKHPLAEPETAKVMIARQCIGDSSTVLRRITALTDELMHLPELSLQNRFAVLDLLDSHAKNHQINLIPEYLETARLRKLTEGALWTTSSAFWKTIGDAYLTCLDGVPSEPSSNEELDFLLPILVGRIIRSLTLQFKWILLRHQRVDEKLWHDLGRTYLFAESRGFDTRRITVYASRHGESSAQTELLKILMFAVSGPDAMTPAHQHISERIIAHFGERFVLNVAPQINCPFAFDLASGKAPSRIGKAGAPPLLVRHFGPGDTQEGLKELSSYLERVGALPPYINAGAQFDRQQIAAVLAHLTRCWADTPVLRHGEREENASQMTVVPGIPENVRWLERMMAASSTTVETPEVAENWLASDTSETGCGVVIPAHPSDWIAIGTLIGIHREAESSYRMAVIRRIIREDDGQHRIGMSYLGEAAAPIALFPTNSSLATDMERPGEAAILLSFRPDAHGHVEVLSRPDGIGKSVDLQMRFRDSVHKLNRVQIIDDTRHYRRASYRIN